MPEPTTIRRALKSAGYRPIPLTGKRPAMDQWTQKIETNFAEIDLWTQVYPYSTNTGILTRDCPTIDIDILVEGAADAIEALVREMFEERGYILVRFGKAPKRAILLRTDAPFKKMATSLIAPDGTTDQKVEVLADGQQVVVFGTHPDTNKPYSWFGGEPGQIKWEDLPYVRAEDIADFLQRATDLLIADFGFKRPVEIREQRGNGTGDYRHANWAQLVSNIVTGIELHDSVRDLSASLIGSGVQTDNVTRMLQAVMLANGAAHDERWKTRFDDIARSVASAAAKYERPAEPPAPTVERATPYDAPDEEKLPQRAIMYGGHYIRQTATTTVAPGGFGKTTLSLFEAVNMVGLGFRVWYLSGEDPRVELDRRIAAHCKEHNVKLADSPGKLFVDDRVSFPLFIGLSLRPGTVRFDDASLARFEHAIVTDKIDVVVLDPFISFHAAPENDNGCIDAVTKRIAGIAQRTNCCIEISHHVRKPFSGQATLTVDDARGGSAIINAVRSARIINRMTSHEAEQARVNPENRASYIRVDRGKRNMAPPDKATWFRLVSKDLRNGDNVQALIPWTFPDLMDGLTVEGTEKIRDMVRKKPFRADTRSDQWLGLEVAKLMNLNANVKADVAKIQAIIGQWLKNGLFQKREMRDPETRKLRIFYVGMSASNDDDDRPTPTSLFDENGGD